MTAAEQDEQPLVLLDADGVVNAFGNGHGASRAKLATQHARIKVMRLRPSRSENSLPSSAPTAKGAPNTSTHGKTQVHRRRCIVQCTDLGISTPEAARSNNQSCLQARCEPP